MNQIEKFLEYRLQQVIPTVYDDSLSYYELVTKVIYKLNEVIDASDLYFAEDIAVIISTMLTDWEASGRLAEIINETLMSEKLNALEFYEVKYC